MSLTNTFSRSIHEDETAPAFGDAFDGVLGAYREEGFQNGYRRAVNDLLAEFPLISQEFLRRQPGGAAELRGALCAFQEYLEQRAGISVRDHFVHEGLGI